MTIKRTSDRRLGDYRQVKPWKKLAIARKILLFSAKFENLTPLDGKITANCAGCHGLKEKSHHGDTEARNSSQSEETLPVIEAAEKLSVRLALAAAK